MPRESNDHGISGGTASAGGVLLIGLLILVGGAYLMVKVVPPFARAIVHSTGVVVPNLAIYSRRWLHWPPDAPLTPMSTVALAAALWTTAGLAMGLLLLLLAKPIVILISTLLGLGLGIAAGIAVLVHKTPKQVSEHLDDYISWDV